MEIALIIALAGLVVFFVVRNRSNERRKREMDLREAWRLVLDDPHYVHRRHYEEKLREDEARMRKEHAILRQHEGLTGEVPPESDRGS